MVLASLISSRGQQFGPANGLQPQRPPAFPFGLDAGGVHELAEAAHGDMAALTGAALAMAGGAGVVLWAAQRKTISAHGRILSDGSRRFGPYGASHQRLFVRVGKPIEVLWAADEGVRSNAVNLVVAEVEDVDFTATRRLKLASERHGVPVILLMPHTREGASACDTRWRISARASAPNLHDMRAPGMPRWRAVLERCRSAPYRAGEIFDLEYDDEALSLRVVSRLAAGSTAADALAERIVERAG